MLSTEKTIGFVIPTYGAKGILLTKTCLETLRKYHSTEEVIVVDDGSEKEVQEALYFYCNKYKAKLLTSFHNQGFSHSVNRGIEQNQSDIVVLTNNDIEFTENISLKTLSYFNANPKLFALGYKLYYPNGNIQHGGVEHKNGCLFYHTDHHSKMEDAIKSNYSRYTIAVTGALQAIRKSFTDKIGVYSTKYQMAYEDVEICLRSWHLGYEVFYTSDICAIHAEGITRGNDTESKKLMDTYDMECQSQKQFFEDLKIYDLKKIDKKIEQLNFENNVGFIRSEALGDCIIATGVIKEYIRRNPSKNVFVYTNHFYPFMAIKDLKKVSDNIQNAKLECSIIFDLDLVYENNPQKERIKAYADHVLGENNYKYYQIKPFLNNICNSKTIAKTDREYVVISPSASWKCRTLPKETWDKVIDYIISFGYLVIMAGTSKDIQPTKRKNFENLSDKLDLPAVRKLISESSLFIGIDSGLLHIAQSTDKPIIGIFTCADPDVVIWRKQDFISITPKDNVCRFCLQQKKEAVTTVDCEKLECIKSITEKEIIEQIGEIL